MKIVITSNFKILQQTIKTYYEECKNIKFVKRKFKNLIGTTFDKYSQKVPFSTKSISKFEIV